MKLIASRTEVTYAPRSFLGSQGFSTEQPKDGSGSSLRAVVNAYGWSPFCLLMYAMIGNQTSRTSFKLFLLNEDDVASLFGSLPVRLRYMM